MQRERLEQGSERHGIDREAPGDVGVKGRLRILGGTAAYAGGASVVRGALRVAFWGALAMGLTAAVGTIFGTAV